MVEGKEHYGAPARVVFADQDAILRELLRALLGCLPHVTVVGEAADGIEAVRLVAQHYPDTVLLDIDMPRLDGFGAAEVIRSFRPRTRLMLHTGRRTTRSGDAPTRSASRCSTSCGSTRRPTSSRRTPSRISIRSRATSSRWCCSPWPDARTRASSS